MGEGWCGTCPTARQTRQKAAFRKNWSRSSHRRTASWLPSTRPYSRSLLGVDFSVDSSDGQVSRLNTLLSDHSLTQLVKVPTHKCGHILDWVVVHTESTCLSFEGVRDCPDL